MTRSSRGDQIQVRPGNDVYTGLAAAACVAVIIGIIAMAVQSNSAFGDGLFFSSGSATTGTR